MLEEIMHMIIKFFNGAPATAPYNMLVIKKDYKFYYKYKKQTINQIHI